MHPEHSNDGTSGWSDDSDFEMSVQVQSTPSQAKVSIDSSDDDVVCIPDSSVSQI